MLFLYVRHLSFFTQVSNKTMRSYWIQLAQVGENWPDFMILTINVHLFFIWKRISFSLELSLWFLLQGLLEIG